MEPRNLPLYTLCWNPQEPRCTHLQSEVSEPGQLDIRTNSCKYSVEVRRTCSDNDAIWAGIVSVQACVRVCESVCESVCEFVCPRTCCHIARRMMYG